MRHENISLENILDNTESVGGGCRAIIIFVNFLFAISSRIFILNFARRQIPIFSVHKQSEFFFFNSVIV